MGSISGPNGEQVESKVFTATVTMNRETLVVNLDTDIKDIDTIMNMLQTALRFLDVQYRIAAGINAQERLRQQQEEMRMASQMMKGARV